MHNVEIDKARGFLYNILSLLFVEENVKNNTPKIIECLEILSNNAFDLLTSFTALRAIY